MGRKQGKQFNLEKRIILAMLVVKEHTAKEIAVILGMNPTSVSRELKRNRSRIKYPLLKRQFVFEHILELINDYIKDIVHTSIEYPTSPYDIEYTENGVKKYIEVKSTSGTKEIFNMSSGEIKLIKRYKDNYILILVAEVTSAFPKAKQFTCDQVLSLKQEYPSIHFYG